MTMADSKSGKTSSGADAAAGVTDRVKAAGEKMRASGEKIAESGANLGMKMLDQAEQNTREAFNAMRAAAKARDLSEVMHVQGDYLREQGTRSMAQAREIGEMIANFGRDTIGKMTGKD
ncbi:phasin family protein [Sphingomonas koreensis]|nr:phasin family protein [Sphingomonas koreensis]